MEPKTPGSVFEKISKKLSNPQMIAVRVNNLNSAPVYVPEYVLHNQSWKFDQLIDRTDNTLLLEGVNHRAIMIWLDGFTGSRVGAIVQEDVMLFAQCMEVALTYGLGEFRHSLRRWNIRAGDVAWLLKFFLQPKFKNAPIRQRLVDMVCVASDTTKPFGMLTVEDIVALDGTGFLAMFNNTMNKQKTSGHSPKRTWDGSKAEDSQADRGVSGTGEDEGQACEVCGTERTQTRKRQKTGLEQDK